MYFASFKNSSPQKKGYITLARPEERGEGVAGVRRGTREDDGREFRPKRCAQFRPKHLSEHKREQEKKEEEESRTFEDKQPKKMSSLETNGKARKGISRRPFLLDASNALGLSISCTDIPKRPRSGSGALRLKVALLLNNTE